MSALDTLKQSCEMGLHKYSSNDDNDKRERKNIIDYYLKRK